MAHLRFTRESFIPKGSRKVAHRHSSAVAYVYERNGKPCAAIFFGKQAKPVVQYRYKDDVAREKSITDYFQRCQSHEASVVERRTERKAYAHNVQVGDIYSTSWGYDQTNVEFFEVIEVRGKFAILREIASAVSHERSGADYVVAQSGAYLAPRYEGDERGQPIRRLIGKSGIKIDDVRSASPWGQRIAGTVVGRPMYETAMGWGH